MARSDPTIYLRIPADLKAQLDAAADAGRRSFTAEAVARLQSTFSRQPDLFGAEADLAHRVAERKLEEKLELLNSQLASVRLHADVIALRLDGARAAKRAAEVRELEKSAAVARRRTDELEAARARLLADSAALEARYREMIRPVVERVEAVVRAELAGDLAQAEALEREVISEIRALNPTAQEVDQAMATEKARIAERWRRLSPGQDTASDAESARPREPIPVMVRGKGALLQPTDGGYEVQPVPAGKKVRVVKLPGGGGRGVLEVKPVKKSK